MGKILLLKKLESDISHNSPLSETSLGYLEILEQVEYDRGIEKVSEAMKSAYCQVAVEYTVKYLRNKDICEAKFCDAVKCVWSRRVRRMEEKAVPCFLVEVRKHASLHRRHVSNKHTMGGSSRTCRGAKIADSDCLEVCPLYKYDFPPTPEVNRVQEQLDSSSLALKAVVKDPLSNDLRFVEPVADTTTASTDHEPMQENHVKPDPSAVNGGGTVRANGGNPSNGARSSLMERNCTTHTHEVTNPLLVLFTYTGCYNMNGYLITTRNMKGLCFLLY
ncbi:HTH myb-type domain-containing protein [Abeliophyllum distichum]|uniref:HTH myb-type domain-containing protein n=1 Tax=Abeliophyllum distichum TaxID=126358 RepID=A0ABD1RCS4_9LAMI